jgi:DNA-binding transcriptional LysR family regulator
MGVRLLTRTTRNVVPTEAGEQLMETLRPAINDIRGRIDALSAMRQQPGGMIRITSSRHAAETILMPKVKQLMADYPDINVEISIEQRFVDLVAERYDAGVRLGESIEKDMIAVRIGPEMRMVVAGSPDYFARNPKPQTPYDLTQHNCINLRLPTLGGLYTWEFERDGRPVNVRVDGQFICNDVPMIIDAALDGLGLTCLPDDHLGPLVDQGRLVQVLGEWCAPFPGYHLYYPSRRLASPAFALLVEALRYR